MNKRRKLLDSLKLGAIAAVGSYVGQKITTILKAIADAGRHTVEYTAPDAEGRVLSSGEQSLKAGAIGPWHGKPSAASNAAALNAP
jgi:hypothetical protein